MPAEYDFFIRITPRPSVASLTLAPASIRLNDAEPATADPVSSGRVKVVISTVKR